MEEMSCHDRLIAVDTCAALRVLSISLRIVTHRYVKLIRPSRYQDAFRRLPKQGASPPLMLSIIHTGG